MTARSHTRLKRKRRRRLRPLREVAIEEEQAAITEGYRLWLADERRRLERLGQQ